MHMTCSLQQGTCISLFFIQFVYPFFIRTNDFHWHCWLTCTQNCCNSLNKKSSRVLERINPFYIDTYGENYSSFQTFWFMNNLQGQIKLVNWGGAVHIYFHSEHWFPTTEQIFQQINRTNLFASVEWQWKLAIFSFFNILNSRICDDTDTFGFYFFSRPFGEVLR